MITRIKAWLTSGAPVKPDSGAEMLNALFERSPVPQAIITDNGVYLQVNTAYCTLHAMSHSELVGKSADEAGVITRVELKALLEAFHQSNGRLEGYSLKCLAHDKPIQARLFAHRIVTGKCSGILVVLHDVSEQRQAEEALKASEQLLQTVLDSIPTRVFWKDKNCVIVGCNHAAARDAGFVSAADAIGKTDDDLYPAEIARQFREDDRHVMSTGTSKLFYEEAVPQRNGVLKWRMTSKVPLRASDGSVIGLLGTYDDITARKQAELDLKLAKFSITNATSSIVWISKDGRLVDFNPAFSHMLQYTREELLALSVPDIDPLYKWEEWPHHWEMLRQKQVLNLLTQHRRKDARILDVEVKAHYLEFDGEEYHCAFVNDVTDQLKAQQRLRASNRFLQAILNNFPDGVFWKDLDSRYLGANTFFMKIANWNGGNDIAGKTDYDFPWAEQAEKLRADDREVMENNAAKLHYVEPLRNADGKIHYNEVNKIPLLDDRGQVMGVLGTFRDITDQVEIEHALKESEKLFKGVVQNASAIIYVIDKDGIIRLSEGLGLAALGLKPGEVIGKSVFEMYNDYPQITTTIRRALQGELIEGEASLNEITFSNRFAPIRNDAGNISGILCVSFDITSRKRLENALEQHVEELKESELKFRQIIQSSPMGIYVYEVNAKGQLILAHTNRAADVITGIESEKLVGKSLEEAFPGLEHTEMPARYMEAALNGTPWIVEDFHFNNGVINGIFEVYAFQAGRNRVAIMFLNISERRQIEASIKLKNEELVKINAELDRFVYSASHDLRAPIASLLGLIEVARSEKDVEGIVPLLSMQERSLLKLDNFIKDIVSYSRNNRVELEVGPIDFKAIVEGIFEQLYHMVDLDRIKQRISIAPDLNFCSDAKRISIILNNLISNAIKYSDVRKDESFVEVCVERNGTGVTISVVDNGEGISAELIPRIFEMFFRATDRSTGSGIGLYIVSEMVNKMQGRIEVQSVKGEGSKFLVWLPDLSS
jgi:PAS domain S-box-containing protein